MEPGNGSHKNPSGAEGDRSDSDILGVIGNIQRVFSNKLEKFAGAMERETDDQNEESGVAQYGEKASVWFHKSASFVREFDYKETDAKVREYVKESPGNSLLIAGAVGLIAGAMLRRR